MQQPPPPPSSLPRVPRKSSTSSAPSESLLNPSQAPQFPNHAMPINHSQPNNGMMQGTIIVPSLNLPPGVIIPPTLNPTPFVSSPKAMELLMSLTPQQMTEALAELDQAINSKGASNIRSLTGYSIGVFKRYHNVNSKQRKNGDPVMTDGLTPVVRVSLQKMVDNGYCTKAEVSDPKIDQKLRMLSEHDALLAIDELVSVPRNTIRNFVNYFAGILNRYQRSAGGGSNSSGRHGRSDRRRRSPSPDDRRGYRSRRHRSYSRSPSPYSRRRSRRDRSRSRSRERYDRRSSRSPSPSYRREGRSSRYDNSSRSQTNLQPQIMQVPQPQTMAAPMGYQNQQMQQMTVPPPPPPRNIPITTNMLPVPGQPAPTSQVQLQSSWDGQSWNPTILQAPQQQQPYQLPQSGASAFPNSVSNPITQNPGQVSTTPAPAPVVGLDLVGLAEKAAAALLEIPKTNPTDPRANFQSTTSRADPRSKDPRAIPSQQPSQSYSLPPPGQPSYSTKSQTQSVFTGSSGQGNDIHVTVSSLPPTVQFAIQNLRASGLLDKELGSNACRWLKQLPEPQALQSLERFSSCDVNTMKNKEAYLCGLLRREVEKRSAKY